MRPTLAALHPQPMPMPQPPVQQPPAPKPVYKAPAPTETQAENEKVCFWAFARCLLTQSDFASMKLLSKCTECGFDVLELATCLW